MAAIRKLSGAKGEAAPRPYIAVLVLIIMLLSFFLPESIMAEEYVSTDINYYKFDGLTILKPMITLNKDLSLNTSILLRVTLDNIETQTTTVDAVSGATKTTTSTSNTKDEDNRKNLTFGVTHAISLYKIDVGYDYSREKDYTSQTPSIQLSRDFFERNTTLAIGYSHNFDNVMGKYMSKAQDKDVNNYSISITQFISPITVAQIGYTYSHAAGYLGTGSRKVALSGGGESDEYLPDSRKRDAVGVRLAQYIPLPFLPPPIGGGEGGGAVHLIYRWYRDDWWIKSNTYGIQYYQYIGENTYVRLEYRYYEQEKAFFYKDSYAGSEQFITSSNLYSQLSSHLYGVKLVHYLRSPNISTEVKYERYRQSTGLDGDIFMFGVKYHF